MFAPDGGGSVSVLCCIIPLSVCRYSTLDWVCGCGVVLFIIDDTVVSSSTYPLLYNESTALTTVVSKYVVRLVLFNRKGWHYCLVLSV